MKMYTVKSKKDGTNDYAINEWVQNNVFVHSAVIVIVA